MHISIALAALAITSTLALPHGEAAPGIAPLARATPIPRGPTAPRAIGNKLSGINSVLSGGAEGLSNYNDQQSSSLDAASSSSSASLTRMQPGASVLASDTAYGNPLFSNPLLNPAASQSDYTPPGNVFNTDRATTTVTSSGNGNGAASLARHGQAAMGIVAATLAGVAAVLL